MVGTVAVTWVLSRVVAYTAGHNQMTSVTGAGRRHFAWERSLLQQNRPDTDTGILTHNFLICCPKRLSFINLHYKTLFLLSTANRDWCQGERPSFDFRQNILLVYHSQIILSFLLVMFIIGKHHTVFEMKQNTNQYIPASLISCTYQSNCQHNVTTELPPRPSPSPQ